MADYNLSVKITGDHADLTKSMEAAAKSVENFKSRTEKVQEKLTALGDGMIGAGKKLTAGITAPLSALGGASMAAFKSVDKGMDIIVQKTGATGDALADLESQAKEIAGTIPASFEEIGSAIGEVNTRFKVSGDEARELSEMFLKFAKVNGTDVSSSIDNVQTLMAAYGVELEDAGLLLDTLNKVGQDTGISMDTLSSTMVTNAASLQQMGMGAADAAKFVGSLEMAGVDTSQVMTGLRTALAKAAGEGKTVSEAMSEMQDAILNAESDTDGLNQAVELFGTRNGPAMYNALKNGQIAFDDLGASIEDNAGNLNATFEGTLDPIDRMSVAFQSLKVLGADVGATMMELVAPAIEKVRVFVNDLRDRFENLSPQAKETIVKVGALAAAIGPLLMVGGSLLKQVSNLLPMLTSLPGKIGGLLSPVNLVVAGIAAVIATLLYLWDTNEEFRKAVMDALESIKAAFAPVGKQLIDIGKAVWSNLKPILDKVGNILANVIIPIIGKILTVAANVISKILSKVVPAIDTIKNIVNALKDTFSRVFEAIRSTVVSVFDRIKSAWSGLTSFVNGVIGGISYAFDSLVSGIKSAVNFVIGGINGAIGIINKIPGVNIGTIGYLASGTDYWRGGLAVINERGGELVNLPDGTQVIPHDISERYAKEAARLSAGESTTYGDLIINLSVTEAQHMDINELTTVISDKIQRAVNRKGAVFA